MELEKLKSKLKRKYKLKNFINTEDVEVEEFESKLRGGGISVEFEISPLASDGNLLIDYNCYMNSLYHDGIHNELHYLISEAGYEVKWNHNNSNNFYIYPQRTLLRYCRG